MTRERFRIGRFLPLPVFLLLLAACGGGGDGGGPSGNDGDGTGDPAPVAGNCEGSGSVTVTGVLQYEFVPAVETATGARLDYAASEFRPIRGAEVRAVCPGESVIHDATFADGNGAFRLTVPENVDVAIRVRAALDTTGGAAPDVRVVDNTRGQAVWSAEGEPFNSGTGNVEVNLRAESGWDGSAYSETRAAAPFAILDSVYTAMQKVLAVDPDARFPDLELNWSPDNRASCTGDSYPFPDGCIGTSFYSNYGDSAGRNIFILGDAGDDTDEYDSHVIIHEWGHYYEDAFSRSDSIGGAHGGGDVLDVRVAFGEGWGNAFSAIATDDPVYVDTRGDNQGSGFTINVENDFEGAAGWWNEGSVQEILYDLYDDANDDAANLGFGIIHAVLTDGQRETAAMTSLFSFIHSLNQRSEASNVREVVAMHDIAEIVDEWGSGRGDGLVLAANDDGSEFGAQEFVTPLYMNLATVTDGRQQNICTTNAFAGENGEYTEFNRLGARRFLRFSVDAAGEWRISVAGETADSDPDFFVWRSGAEQTDSGGAPSVSGTNFSSAMPNPDGVADNTEVADVALSLETVYVLEVMDWLNVDDENTTTDGELCLDITFDKL
ncbi:MAG TPA: hypothetical protein VF267_05365 [Gammaproteobacteria bacterium]